MPRLTPDEFMRIYSEQRASAILRTPYGEAAGPAMEATMRSGFRVVEFTLTVPGAFDRIEERGRALLAAVRG